MDKLPDDRDARRAFLEEWAKGQRSRLAEEARRLAEEERRRQYAQEIARVVAQARQHPGQVNSLRGAAAIPVVITKPSDLPAGRAAVFADLMARLREHMWADPIVSQCDEPSYIAPNALELARRHRPDAPWLLYMEDDVILGPHFELLPELLREAEERFPDAGIVSFFSGSWIWQNGSEWRGYIEPGWSIHRMERFGWLQCAAIRNTDYLGRFRTFIEDLVTRRTDKPPTSRTRQKVPTSRRRRPDPPSDKALATFLAAEYDTFALWCPSLVQHADLASVFPGTQHKRNSRSYKQAYG
jgi:hypothetical protein